MSSPPPAMRFYLSLTFDDSPRHMGFTEFIIHVEPSIDSMLDVGYLKYELVDCNLCEMDFYRCEMGAPSDKLFTVRARGRKFDVEYPDDRRIMLSALNITEYPRLDEVKYDDVYVCLTCMYCNKLPGRCEKCGERTMCAGNQDAYNEEERADMVNMFGEQT